RSAAASPEPGLSAGPPPRPCAPFGLRRPRPGAVGVRRPRRTAPLRSPLRAEPWAAHARHPRDLGDHDQPDRPAHRGRPRAPPAGPDRPARRPGPAHRRGAGTRGRGPRRPPPLRGVPPRRAHHGRTRPVGHAAADRPRPPGRTGLIPHTSPTPHDRLLGTPLPHVSVTDRSHHSVMTSFFRSVTGMLRRGSL